MKNKNLGDEDMMAFFIAQRVILGKTDFSEIPAALQPAVYEHLVDSGLGFMAGDYMPPVKP